MPNKSINIGLMIAAIGSLLIMGNTGQATSSFIDTEVITKESDYEIRLNSMDDNVSEQQINFDATNIEAPDECSDPMVICEEESLITINTIKTWHLYRVREIDDPELTSSDFARLYPDLDEEQSEINDLSPPEEKFTVQRILYDRGLLEREPTGKIGYETELAICKLQQLKGLSEYDPVRGICAIGPETIRELNALKERMQDENYLIERPLPEMPPEVLVEPYSKRAAEINHSLTNPQESATSSSGRVEEATEVSIEKPPNHGARIQFEGSAVIKGQRDQW